MDRLWRWVAAPAAAAVLAAGCTGDPDEPRATGSASASRSPSSMPPGAGQPSTTEPSVDRVVTVGAQGRGIYIRCSGTGSPTVVLEGGDEDTSDSYAFAERTLAAVTQTCVYDRANLGRSDPDRRRRGLSELVEDLEGVLESAQVPGPYVLVGTSGGGYITAGYAVSHPRMVVGMVFVEVPSPFRNPPAPIVEETRWNSAVNVESRDYLQVEKDAWAARRVIRDIPITVISNEYSAGEIAAAQFPSEARGMRSNVADQRGWLVLSPQAKQVVVHTGHAVEEADPDLVMREIMDVVMAARSRPST